MLCQMTLLYRNNVIRHRMATKIARAGQFLGGAALVVDIVSVLATDSLSFASKVGRIAVVMFGFGVGGCDWCCNCRNIYTSRCSTDCSSICCYFNYCTFRLQFNIFFLFVWIKKTLGIVRLMSMINMIRVFFFGLICGTLGMIIGYPTGVLIAKIGIYLNFDKWLLLTVSTLVFGGVIFILLLPLENRYIWSRIKGIDIKDIDEFRKDNFIFGFAPISFFLIVGVLLGIQLN